MLHSRLAVCHDRWAGLLRFHVFFHFFKMCARKSLVVQAQRMGGSMSGALKVGWRWLCWTGNIRVPSAVCSLTPDTWPLSVLVPPRWAQTSHRLYFLCTRLANKYDLILVYHLFLFQTDFLAPVCWWLIDATCSEMRCCWSLSRHSLMRTLWCSYCKIKYFIFAILYIFKQFM